MIGKKAGSARFIENPSTDQSKSLNTIIMSGPIKGYQVAFMCLFESLLKVGQLMEQANKKSKPGIKKNKLEIKIINLGFTRLGSFWQS